MSEITLHPDWSEARRLEVYGACQFCGTALQARRRTEVRGDTTTVTEYLACLRCDAVARDGREGR